MQTSDKVTFTLWCAVCRVPAFTPHALDENGAAVCQLCGNRREVNPEPEPPPPKIERDRP